jgi:peptidoglycan L-alanyl-D-glutamate endopeptidase CwlK
MAIYSQISKDKLSQAHPDLQVLFNWVVKYYDNTIADTYRTKALQHQYVHEGKSKVDYPTVHNTKPSHAIDAYPYEATGIDWGQLQSAYFAGWVMAASAMLYEQGKMTHRVRCGLDWDKDNDVDDNSFWDAGHFELIQNPGEILKYFPE